MLDWIAAPIMAIVTFIPVLFVDKDSPNFMLIRSMFGLLLIVLIVYLLAMRPLRSMIATCRLLAPAYYLLNRLHDWKFVILLIITEVFQLAQICFEAL
jgi:hypothetical protein